ncbi:DUF3889 domain-containing protein [Paenibacillus azoreducens]|uniref:DUF3889 domain-containing protein n=1 Tax=Paenibacillus azoreducens TaxID=116718 RepID=A0A919YAC6_9BACL|nr:DUF3889 domain-containing protein [Paenibacillus azoreducens]GIO47086.1 hypothetical protein J34TS1_18510 [Paenibacillus azoreducens]
MRRSLLCFIVSMVLLTPCYVHAAPDYTKFGKIAMRETQKRYPNASIIDYLHMGRSVISPVQTEEKFRLWLRRRDQAEFGVYVSIIFNSKTEEVQSIQFNETDR